MVEAEINLTHYLFLLNKARKPLLLFVFGVTFIVAIITLFLPKSYRADATLLPISNGKGPMSESMAALVASQITGGMSQNMGGNSSSSAGSQLMIILRSRTLAQRVISQSDLIKDLFPGADKNNPPLEEGVDALQGMVDFSEDKKSGLITVFVTAPNAALAANIANDYLKDLTSYISENTLTASKNKRVFIEKQLERNKTDLLESGKELSSFYAENNVSNTNPEVDVDVSLNKDWTPAPQGLPAGSSEADAKSDQLKKGLEENETQLRQSKLVRHVPQQIYLQYLTVRRELLGQMNMVLTQQYEMAKIDEAKEDLNFQIIDWARVPKLRFKPERKKIVMLTFIVSLLSGVFFIFLEDYSHKIREEIRLRSIPKNY